MAEETIRMSQREQNRMIIFTRVKSGEWTLAQAAESMRVSYRQAKRIHARWKKRGASGLTHASRGREGNRAKTSAFRKQALDLVREHYADYGPTLAAERLAEVHGLVVDHETLRRWMKREGMWVGRRAERKHRRRRKRRERVGQMVQLDGSLHDWFEGRAAPCCLMVLVDDATGRKEAWFSPEETTEGAMRVLLGWIRQWGVPGSIYADRKTVYFTEPSAPQTPNEPTAFGAVCGRMDIEMIRAHSPQGKGRVERANGVLQDRLVKAMREAGISTIEAANEFLPEFMRSHNARFEVEPVDKTDAHRAADIYDLGAIFAWEEPRVVSRDNVVRFESRFFQLETAVRPGAKITVRRRLDGKLQLLDGSQEIAWSELPAPPAPAPKPPTPSPAPRAPHKPPPDHPWRKSLLRKTAPPTGTPKPKKEKHGKLGALPPNPRSLSLEKRPHEEADLSLDKKQGGHPASSRTPPHAVRARHGARVALQRSPILRTGKKHSTSGRLRRRSA
jgi:transposase